VEGGLSRFLAVYSSHVPPVVGPVPSAREDDLELLRQFGRPAFADGGTAFTTLSGQVMTFARGPTWIVLAAAHS